MWGVGCGVWGVGCGVWGVGVGCGVWGVGFGCEVRGLGQPGFGFVVRVWVKAVGRWMGSTVMSKGLPRRLRQHASPAVVKQSVAQSAM